MRTASCPSQSLPRSMTVDLSPFSSPTLPPPPLPLPHTSTPFPASSISRSLSASLPGCPFASPPTKLSSPSTPSLSPSSLRTQKRSSRVLRNRSSTLKTYVSCLPDTSIPTHNPGRASRPPPSLSPSTQVTCSRWAPQFDSFPVHETLNAPTLPIGTLSARTAGVSATSPPGAPPPLPFAPSAPSTTPGQCTGAPTLPALEVATLRLLLAVVLPRHHAAPIAEAPTLRLTGIVTPVQLLPLSGAHPLPTRSFSRRPLTTRWTRPPTTMTSCPPLHPPAPSSRRSRWLLQGPEGQQYFRPL